MTNWSWWMYLLPSKCIFCSPVVECQALKHCCHLCCCCSMIYSVIILFRWLVLISWNGKSSHGPQGDETCSAFKGPLQLVIELWQQKKKEKQNKLSVSFCSSSHKHFPFCGFFVVFPLAQLLFSNSKNVRMIFMRGGLCVLKAKL